MKKREFWEVRKMGRMEERKQGKCGLGKVAVFGRNKESGLKTPPTVVGLGKKEVVTAGNKESGLQTPPTIVGLGKKDKERILFCDLYPFLRFCVKGV